MKPKRYLIVLFVLVSVGSRARADLKWAQTTIEVHPTVFDQAAVAHFKYKNAGTTPVHIISAQPSCGCTVATLEKYDVRPGEEGELTATLNIGDRFGREEKNVTVYTSDPAVKSTVLTLDAIIPRMLEVQPVFVFWNANEALQPKELTIKVPPESPVKNVSVTSSTPEIKAKLSEVSPGKEWKVVITPPKDGSKMMAANLDIRPEYGAKNPKIFQVFVRVLPRPVY